MEHHNTITDTMVGVVLACFEGAMLISSPIVSVLLERVGRKRFIVIGNVMTLLASVGFGLLVYIEDDMTFFGLSLCLRAF